MQVGAGVPVTRARRGHMQSPKTAGLQCRPSPPHSGWCGGGSTPLSEHDRISLPAVSARKQRRSQGPYPNPAARLRATSDPAARTPVTDRRTEPRGQGARRPPPSRPASRRLPPAPAQRPTGRDRRPSATDQRGLAPSARRSRGHCRRTTRRGPLPGTATSGGRLGASRWPRPTNRRGDACRRQLQRPHVVCVGRPRFLGDPHEKVSARPQHHVEQRSALLRCQGALRQELRDVAGTAREDLARDTVDARGATVAREHQPLEAPHIGHWGRGPRDQPVREVGQESTRPWWLGGGGARPKCPPVCARASHPHQRRPSPIVPSARRTPRRSWRSRNRRRPASNRREGAALPAASSPRAPTPRCTPRPDREPRLCFGRALHAPPNEGTQESKPAGGGPASPHAEFCGDRVLHPTNATRRRQKAHQPAIMD